MMTGPKEKSGMYDDGMPTDEEYDPSGAYDANQDDPQRDADDARQERTDAFWGEY